MGERIGDRGHGVSWTDWEDGEYRTERYFTLSPRLYYAWHARYPGRYPTEWRVDSD